MSEAPPVRYVLFPGRHHLLTNFQARYLSALLASEVFDSSGTPVRMHPDAAVVFAITSADHGNTRRNPVAGHRREAQVERFSTLTGIRCLTFLVDDVPTTDRFGRYMLESIAADAGPHLSPRDTLVATSTPAVAGLFEPLGFRIATVERRADGGVDSQLPWDLLERAVADASFDAIAAEVHRSSRDVWERYSLLEHAVRVSSDPLLGSEGDITGTRDYRTYAASFDSGAARKWKQLRAHVRPGRVVDIGCGAGSLLAEAAADPALAESDLYGIEAARPLFEECQHRRRAGLFPNTNTFFFQRNFMADPIFEARSIDSTITTALTHEIWSYLGDEALRSFVGRVFAHTRPGGAWLNLDVAGPRDGERVVWLEPLGGEQADPALQLDAEGWPVAAELDRDDADAAAALVSRLSPLESFVQFARDWHFEQPWTLLRSESGTPVIETTQRMVMEWLSRKDYPDNWLSEMHESFAHYDLEDWRALLERVGFELAPGSAAWTNPWLAEHRFDPAARLHPRGSLDERLPWPDTHVLLVATRPRLERSTVQAAATS